MERRVHRPRAAMLSAAVMVPVVLGGTGVAHAGGHEVVTRWEPTFVDVGGSKDPDIVDVFVTRGSPFGRGRVITRTPREQRSDLVRTPTFVIRTRHGRITGRLTVKKTYLETTATHQLTRYEGTGRFTGGTKRYLGASGRISRVFGKVDCFRTGCDGQLKVTGRIRY